MKLITPTSKISKQDLALIAQNHFANMVKAIVDIKKEIILIDAKLHADEEAYLIQQGSKQENLWGINLYPDLEGNNFIEFDCPINLRPSQNNLTRNIDNPQIRKKIINLVSKLIH